MKERPDGGRPHGDPAGPRQEPVGACPLCGDDRSEVLWTLPDRLYGVPGEYRYVRCSGCGSVYQSPRVREEDLHRCYPAQYYTHGDGDEGDEGGDRQGGLRSVRDRIRGWIRWAVQGGDVGNGGDAPGWPARAVGRILARSRMLRERAFFGLVDPVIPRSGFPGRALEIGSGSGWELSLLSRSGWTAEGVEVDPAAAEGARRSYGVPVRVGDFPEVVGPDERFDLIYLSHVFEHLPDLEETLRFFRRHVGSGGRVVLVFPNLHALGARVWERSWQGWDPPRHLVLPTHAGIRNLARRTGLHFRIETRARGATFIHAASRAIERRAGTPLNPRAGAGDRLLAVVEGLLVAAGLPLGEETVVVLEVAEGAEGAEGTEGWEDTG